MIYNRRAIFFYLISLFCVSSSCRTIEASIPELQAFEAEELKPKESVMSIELQINMDPVLNLVEKSTPKTFTGAKTACEGVSYNYDFRRNPIVFTTSSKDVNYTLKGDFSLKLNYCPLCVSLLGKSSCTVPRIYGSCGIGEPRRRYIMTYGTSIKLNKDYSLSSKTRLKSFQINDPCKITFVNIDVTKKVKAEVENELKAMESKIDKEISSIDVKSKVDSVWRTLIKPVELVSYGYLFMNPNRITISDLRYQDKDALFTLNLFFSPFISTQKQEVINSNLGDMPEHQQVNGFDITADINASYDSLSSLLRKEFYNYEILIKGRAFIIKDLSIIGVSDGKLVFKVVFDGHRNGIFYLIGTPVLDEVNQVLSFEDIDFEIKTKSFLLKSAQWLMSKSLINQIKAKSSIDLSQKLSAVKSQLMEKLNGKINDGVVAETSINDLRIMN
ncbi:MAG: DUF4403 family protein, partial [Crocinitomicaceae bacterium]|nr:DUF4403 family protein [Crocinitomicaceae bacterium]